MLAECSLQAYHAAIARGALTPADRVELLYGKLVAYMPSGPSHAQMTADTADFLRDRLGNKYQYREEKPVTFAFAESEPEPDVAVVEKKRYSSRHPVAKEIYLVVEVAQDSVRKDRGIKSMLYAEAGVPEYWIVNLPKQHLEVYLNPDSEDRRYQSVIAYGTDDTFDSPLVGRVTVSELFLPST